MPFTDVNLHYDLTRRQRLTVHLRGWMPNILPYLFVVAIMMGLIAMAAMRSPWYWLLAIFPLWVMRGFIAGFANIIFVPLEHMDIRITEHTLGFVVGKQRWWTHLDSIVRIERFHDDLWTFCCYHGKCICVPVTMISDETLAHIRKKMAWANTPEGIQASVQRGHQVVNALLGRNPSAEASIPDKSGKPHD